MTMSAYKTLVDVNVDGVTFEKEGIVKISTRGEGGGFGFGHLIIINIEVENPGKDIQRREERSFRSKDFLIANFVEKSPSIFEKIV